MIITRVALFLFLDPRSLSVIAIWHPFGVSRMYAKLAAKCPTRLNCALIGSITLVFLWCTLVVFIHPYSRAAQYPGSNSKLLHNHWEALTQSTNFTAPTIPALVVAGRDFQRLSWMDDVAGR